MSNFCAFRIEFFLIIFVFFRFFVLFKPARNFLYDKKKQRALCSLLYARPISANKFYAHCQFAIVMVIAEAASSL